MTDRDEIIKGVDEVYLATGMKIKELNQAISILKRIDEGEIFKILVENILVTDTVRIAYGGKVAKAIVKWIINGKGE